MKFITILGARPQFIKAATVSRRLKDYNRLSEVIIHTGQHYDKNMSKVFFEELHIPKPDYNLQVGSKTHARQTAEMLIGIEDVLLNERPDMVLVYGDTNSTLAGALAAAKIHIPIAHIEAGLRSKNLKMPEEVNRVLTDQISKYLFTPTSIATNNLLNEGHSANSIEQIGDVMYDAAIYYSGLLHEADLKLPEKYVLVTIHRAENTDSKENLTTIINQLDDIGSDWDIIFPIHPRTSKMIKKFKIPKPKNIQFLEPVGYLDMIRLEANSSYIITDSGGVQKEAFFFEKPCITIRDETEWVELVANGYNRLTKPDSINKALNDYNFPKDINSLYGDGDASTKFLEYLNKL